MSLSFPMNVSQVFPNRKTVQVRTRGINGNADKYYDVNDFSVRPLSRREVFESNGFYHQLDRRFAVSIQTLDAINLTIELGAAIKYQGLWYTVIEQPTIGEALGRVKCVGRNNKIVHQLTDVVEIWRDYGRGVDSEGRNNADYQLFLDDVDSRVQPVDGQADETFGVPGIGRDYRLPVDIDVQLYRTDQVRLADGRIFEIAEVQNRERIDLLPVLICKDNGARWE